LAILADATAPLRLNISNVRLSPKQWSPVVTVTARLVALTAIFPYFPPCPVPIMTLRLLVVGLLRPPILS